MPAKKSKKKGARGAQKQVAKPEKVRKAKAQDEGDPMYNEIDDFANKREKITFKKGDMGYSDEDDEDSMDNDEVDPSLHQSDSSDHDDDENDMQQPFNEDDEEAYEDKRQKDIESEKNLTKAWGNKKKDYYGADVEEFELLNEDEEDAELEETEAISQQKVLLFSLCSLCSATNVYSLALFRPTQKISMKKIWTLEKCSRSCPKTRPRAASKTRTKRKLARRRVNQSLNRISCLS